MRYKIEFYYERKLFYEQFVDEVATLHQAVYTSVITMKQHNHSIPLRFDSLIMNENGDIWSCHISYELNKLKIRKDMKFYVGERIVSYVFDSHNKQIAEVI